MGTKSEFDFLRDLKSKYHLNHVGDDCAVLPMSETHDLLVTADMLVEDVDFRLEWTTPEFLGHKALAVSLSDIAAMGGTPEYGMVSIGVPENLWKTDFGEKFYDGWHQLAGLHSVTLIGGDISRVPEHLVIDCTVLGKVRRGAAFLRSGAKPGDAIFVTGPLGGAAAGLKLLENGVQFGTQLSTAERHLLLRQLQPIPQIVTAKLLQQYQLVTSMIDISDGLSSDLQHLTALSNVGAQIDGSLIPIDPAIPAVGFDNGVAYELALNSGEDLELLFTVDPINVFRAVDLGYHSIGIVSEKAGELDIIQNGSSSSLAPKGYRHF